MKLLGKDISLCLISVFQGFLLIAWNRFNFSSAVNLTFFFLPAYFFLALASQIAMDSSFSNPHSSAIFFFSSSFFALASANFALALESS